jgi:multicomponent Na+:H+ antiporter subunit D
VTGRVFAGLGQVAGEEERAPTEAEREKANRPLWLMLTPTALLLFLALAAAYFADPLAKAAALQVMEGETAGPAGEPLAWLPWVSVALAVTIAALDLFRGRVGRLAERLSSPLSAAFQAVHSGIVGDYVTWLTVGLALFAFY